MLARGAGLVLGGIEVDGGGVFVVGGVPHPVPPWNPFTAVLEQLAAYRAADMIADPITQIQAKKVALSAILDTVGQREIERAEDEPRLGRGGDSGLGGAVERNGL